MSSTVLLTTVSTTPLPSGRWNVCLLVTDIVMCVLVIAGCFVGLLGEWAFVEVATAKFDQKKSFTLADLRNMGSEYYSNTESAAKAATAFLALLIVCAAVVGVLAIVWIVSPSSGLRFYPLTTVPISLFGILSIAMTAWSWGALLDDVTARKETYRSYTITVAAEAGGVFALIAGVLACILGIVKCSALCCCRPTVYTLSTQSVGASHIQGAPVTGVIQHGMVAQPQQFPVQTKQYTMQPHQNRVAATVVSVS